MSHNLLQVLYFFTQKDYDVVVSEKYSFQGEDTHRLLCTDVKGLEFSEKSCGETVIVRVYSVELTLNS